jgi:hypothetical protein
MQTNSIQLTSQTTKSVVTELNSQNDIMPCIFACKKKDCCKKYKKSKRCKSCPNE